MNMGVCFTKMGVCLMKMGVCFKKMEACFMKMEVCFTKMEVLFCENGSLLAETKRSFPLPLALPEVKAGVHVKAVLTSLNTAFLPISRSCFKRR